MSIPTVPAVCEDRCSIGITSRLGRGPRSGSLTRACAEAFRGNMEKQKERRCVQKFLVDDEEIMYTKDWQKFDKWQYSFSVESYPTSVDKPSALKWKNRHEDGSGIYGYRIPGREDGAGYAPRSSESRIGRPNPWSPVVDRRGASPYAGGGGHGVWCAVDYLKQTGEEPKEGGRLLGA